jgi:hypothetical protein
MDFWKRKDFSSDWAGFLRYWFSVKATPPFLRYRCERAAQCGLHYWFSVKATDPHRACTLSVSFAQQNRATSSACLTDGGARVNTSEVAATALGRV